MKKLVFLLFAFLFGSYAMAAQVDHFILTPSANPVKINEAIDLTIKAVDADWNTVKDYLWDIFMEMWSASESDYVLPNDWLYTFMEDDQWEKIFSKWLIFKKAWEYTLTVYDVAEDTIKQDLKITVTWEWASAKAANVTITSPIAWSTEKSKVVNVTGKSTLPNSPFVLSLDWKKSGEWITDENWDFTSSLENLKVWDHKIKVAISNADNKVLWESEEVSFKYGQDEEDWLKSVVVKPSNTVSQWTKATVVVTVADIVTSADISVWTDSALPMTKKWSKEFTKELTMDKAGSFKLSLKLTASGNSKDYKDVETITVNQVKRINEVKYYTKDWMSKWLTLEWTYSWDIKNFRIDYGLKKTDLNLNAFTWTNKIFLSWVDLTQTNYFQIFPVTLDKNPDWIPSDIIEVKPSHNAWGSCKITWIKIDAIQQWGKYYLTWPKVKWVKKYIIYKSESESKSVKTMQKVWETTDLKFEYPFDAKSKKEIYSFYAVEWECEDGSRQTLDIKKVKVWPMDTLLVTLLLSVFLYFGYKLYNYSRN